ncbi:ribosomal protein S7 domain-containing protein [Xylariaceae sp. FL1019]|nr:ribosomal protein S7 domain-containing protein [Xylariaceae sp. FL1019]
MASKLNPFASLRSLAIRTRPVSQLPRHHVSVSPAMIARRSLADDMDTRGHPQEPEEMIDIIPPRDWTPIHEPFADNYLNVEAIAKLQEIAAGQQELEWEEEGLKYGMPRKPTKNEKLQDRHAPVINQITRLLMRDGKLSQAQTHLSLILNYLRTHPAPKVSPLRPLLPGSPPANELPLNPLLYLELAIDSVAPIIRVRNMKGIAGGGQTLEVPEPMDMRSRRRVAIKWILDIVEKKRSTGSGRKQFAARFGSEIVSIVEGRSALWEKRQLIHKLGTASRANLAHPKLAGNKRRR